MRGVVTRQWTGGVQSCLLQTRRTHPQAAMIGKGEHYNETASVVVIKLNLAFKNSLN